MKPLQGIWVPPDLSMQPVQGNGKEQIKTAAKQIEVVFLSELLKNMMEHTSFGKDKTVGTYLTMVTTEIAASLSERGIGVQDFILKNSTLDRMVEEGGAAGEVKSQPEPDAETPESSRGLTMPVRGMISSSYGSRNDPFRSGAKSNHQGVDIAVPEGTKVAAAASGKVKYSGYSNSYGNYIIIEHEDRVSTLYAHNSANLVKAGDMVEGGTPIALSGSTGHSTGPHLHFEVRREGKPIDPVDMVG